MSDDSIQEAMLSLIEACGHWNAFNGPSIVRDLRKNRRLWRSAILVGPGERIYLNEGGDFVSSERDFSAHRGLPMSLLGFDVLQLTPSFGEEDNLENLADQWGSDSVTWIGFPQACTAAVDLDEETYRQSGGDPNRVLLELWWD